MNNDVISTDCASTDSFLVYDDQAKRAYRRWQSSEGALFTDAPYIAIDCETMAINIDQPELIPALVIAAVSDGQTTRFLMPEDLDLFFEHHRNQILVFHNAAFDLPVLQNHLRFEDLEQRVDDNQVRDTMILHRLVSLALNGSVACNKGESTLDACARMYLRDDLAKQITDEEGHDVRTGFARFFKRPFKEIPGQYLEYLARDAQVTARIFNAMKQGVSQLFPYWSKNPPLGIPEFWGKGSPGMLGRISGKGHNKVAEFFIRQFEKWGPFSHHIQLKASLALNRITRNGLHIDLEMAQATVARLEQQKQDLAHQMTGLGLQPEGPNSQTLLQAAIRKLDRQFPQLDIPRTAGDKYITKEEVLQSLAPFDPSMALLAEYRQTTKLLSTFAQKLDKPVLHPRFQTLVRTGRTSSFGDINAQNLPRDNEFRKMIIPSPGHVFIKADYSMIELCALAQVITSQLAMTSQMARRINAGIDLHTFTAAQLLNKPVELVSDEERRKAKAINFGKPGGLGNAALRDYARQSYGVEMTEHEARQLSERWMKTFPEMETFLKSGVNGGVAAARMLSLTPNDHCRATRDGRLMEIESHIEYPDGPSGILGSMFLRTMAYQEPSTNEGKPYPGHDVEYFWQRAQQFISRHGDQLPPEMVERVRQRQAHIRLGETFEAAAMRVCVVTLTGRVRNWASFAASRNTLFQGLAADGAKLAMWNLHRAGYRIVNFIHDEFLIEVPENSDLAAHVQSVEKLMIEGMKQVLPNIDVRVESKLLKSWSTKDTVELPAPVSFETSQKNPSGPCAANSPFPSSSIPSSGWGFGHPGRLDAVSLDVFGELFQAGDDEPEEELPI